MGNPMADLREIPSVEKLLQDKKTEQLLKLYGRPLTILAVRRILDEIRVQYSSQQKETIPRQSVIIKRVENTLEDYTQPTLVPVINATGVILHTNLGRAPLSEDAILAMETVARDYTNLEFDLYNGKRGSRLLHAEKNLKLLLEAQDVLVVNNNASAILLALSALSYRKRVIISRTQLVEIGGGFRIPDVMKQSGAKLVEIGTTNQVHLSDYELALKEPTNLVMRVHRSNFKIIGFTSEPEFIEVVEKAHNSNIPVLDDLGSGALLRTEEFGLAHEPTVQDSLKAGADLVCFSGDKLLGGPQAGIIVGRADLLRKIKKHPIARAVRADKFCLAALTATLTHYLKDEAHKKIPIWRMISTPLPELQARAENWRKVLEFGEIISGFSTVGGGSLPGETIPTWLLSLRVDSPDKLLARLRSNNPPIIARTENNKVLLDPRTILPENEKAFLFGLQKALKKR